jgi:ubiquitin-activating enzyme E1
LYCSNTIKQLLHNFPADQKTSTGTPFWSGAKRCPHPLTFSLENVSLNCNVCHLLIIMLCVQPEHFEFVYSGAILRAQEYRLKPLTDREQVIAILQTHKPPTFVPKSGVRIAVTDTEAQQQAEEGQCLFLFAICIFNRACVCTHLNKILG